MKKVISVLCALAVVAASAFAQAPQKEGKGRHGNNWRERVRAEKVAFLTSELNLTEAEAQAFWPVYNKVQEENRAAYKAQGEAYKNLKAALEEGSGDTAALLDAYLSAKSRCDALGANALPKFKAVLPIEKVARLYIAEEKFRHQQIGRLGGRHGGPDEKPQMEHPEGRGQRRK